MNDLRSPSSLAYHRKHAGMVGDMEHLLMTARRRINYGS
jgi:hypothetical protein